MPRRYSDEQKQQAIERLIANGGDVTRTSAESGIPENTLWRWRRAHQIPVLPKTLPPPPPPQNLPLSNALERGPGGEVTHPLPADLSEALLEVRGELMDVVRYLTRSIRPAVDEAPLNQRVMAVAQLIDRVVKLGVQVPGEPVEVIIRNAVEKEEDDEDGIDTTEDSSQPEEDYPL
jgi:transposase-like protein